MTTPLRHGTITCPICEQPATVRYGRVMAHANVIRGWADDEHGKRIMADITVTCAPKIRVVQP
jgi:hypothetical protein